MRMMIVILLVIAIAQLIWGDRIESIQTAQSALLIAILVEVRRRDK